jgi:hypothetical protein
MKGAQEGGFMGGLVGFGKGVGGAVFKPAAGKRRMSVKHKCYRVLKNGQRRRKKSEILFFCLSRDSLRILRLWRGRML